MASQQPADVFTENSRSGLEVEINELNKRIQELQQKLSDTHEVKDKALYDEREAWKLFEAKKYVCSVLPGRVTPECAILPHGDAQLLGKLSIIEVAVGCLGCRVHLSTPLRFPHCSDRAGCRAECDRLKKKNEKASETLAGQAKALQDAQETADKLASQRASIMKKVVLLGTAEIREPHPLMLRRPGKGLMLFFVFIPQLEKLEVEKSKHEKERRQSEADAKIWCTEADGKAAIEYAERVTRSRLGEGASDEEVSAAMATDQLELDLAKVIKEIELAETAAGGTLEELELTLKSHEKRYRRDRARYDEVHNMMMVFHKSVHLREQSLKKLDRNTEANVQSRFKHYMSLKASLEPTKASTLVPGLPFTPCAHGDVFALQGHVGTIKLNRKDCELVMSVTISNQKNQKDSGPVEDLKSLSGESANRFWQLCV